MNISDKYEIKAKPMEKVTLEDMQRFPIWEFAYDEECEEGQDETWQKPVLSTTEAFTDSCILLKVKEEDIFVSAHYMKGKLFGLCFWDEISENFIPLKESDMKAPLILCSIPYVQGVQNREFIVYDIQKDEAICPELKEEKKKSWFKRLL